MASVLAVGTDERLLATRAAVLRVSHADVVQVNPHQALELLRTLQFDLVVLCHTVSPEEAVELANAQRTWMPGVPVLQVVPLASPKVPPSDRWADERTDGSPVGMVDKVKSMLIRPSPNPAI